MSSPRAHHSGGHYSSPAAGGNGSGAAGVRDTRAPPGDLGAGGGASRASRSNEYDEMDFDPREPEMFDLVSAVVGDLIDFSVENVIPDLGEATLKRVRASITPMKSSLPHEEKIDGYRQKVLALLPPTVKKDVIEKAKADRQASAAGRRDTRAPPGALGAGGRNPSLASTVKAPGPALHRMNTPAREGRSRSRSSGQVRSPRSRRSASGPRGENGGPTLDEKLDSLLLEKSRLEARKRSHTPNGAEDGQYSGECDLEPLSKRAVIAGLGDVLEQLDVHRAMLCDTVQQRNSLTCPRPN